MTTFPLPGPLVDDSWLAARLDDPRLVVLDATVLLPSPRHDGDHRCVSGREGWLRRRLPGSRHADLTGDFSDPGAPYHFAVPSPPALAGALAGVGVGEGSAVVVYDTGGGIWAARLWWMLRAISVPAAVLDGGLAAWESAGRPLTSGDDAVPVPEVTPVVPVPRPGSWTDVHEVEAISRGERPGTLVCALPPGGFDGSVPTRYSRRGHIPGSRSLPGRELLDAEGRVLSPADLATRVGAGLDATDTPVVLYCGGGISAAGVALALTLLGRPDVSLYDGSLEEWSQDPARPLTTGHVA
ncbi:sulfurtransferase [Streptomyces rishiriensis]|uniref:Thiosulfate/3-mercaptopyruvate sulfurtransferase n=1 Tax=Streptomyces rishiriensis TaxID=68264 RepID=A0ABU0P1Z5_STRRH|nr:rhodanese-like domain-containing protein [Streptomyces rishiriensis]MDQ0584772.1 thiosulfate/3-mercaptopyruvate sulfurtransferase [Streptomyces rishiriensis]